MSFKIQGFSDLSKKLEVMPKALGPTYVQVMQKSVLHVRREAQSITPVRTGNLRASARSSATSTAQGASGMVMYRADYAVPVHERTWTNLISGQHKFLEKSVHRSRRVLRSFLLNGLKSALRRFSVE